MAGKAPVAAVLHGLLEENKSRLIETVHYKYIALNNLLSHFWSVAWSISVRICPALLHAHLHCNTACDADILSGS